MRIKSKFNIYYSLLSYFSILMLSFYSLGDKYAYYGYEIAPNVIKIVYSYIVVLMLSIVLTKKRSTILVGVYWILSVLWLVPALVYYSITNQSSNFMFGMLSGFAVIIIINDFIPSYKVRGFKVSNQAVVYIIYYMIALNFGITIIINGLPTLTALNVNEIYTVRRAYISNTILEYLQSWTLYVASPFIMGYGYQYKRKGLILLGLMMNIFHFLCSGGRYSLFILIIVIFLVYIHKKPNIGLIFSCLISFLVLISTYIFWYSGINNFYHLFMIRPLIMPSFMAFIYHDFFSFNPLLMMSEIFPSMLNSPYNNQSTVVIGDYLFGAFGGAWATGNWMANAYANVGYSGILIFALIYGLVLNFAKNIYSSNNNSLAFYVSFLVTSHHLIHTSVFTVLASRGMLFCILLGLITIPLKSSRNDRLQK